MDWDLSLLSGDVQKLILQQVYVNLPLPSVLHDKLSSERLQELSVFGICYLPNLRFFNVNAWACSALLFHRSLRLITRRKCFPLGWCRDGSVLIPSWISSFLENIFLGIFEMIKEFVHVNFQTCKLNRQVRRHCLGRSQLVVSNLSSRLELKLGLWWRIGGWFGLLEVFTRT